MRLKYCAIILLIATHFGCVSNKATHSKNPILEDDWAPQKRIDSLKYLQQKVDSVVIEKHIEILTSVDDRFINVIEFGNSLKQWKSKSTDSLTIYSDIYWKAFVTMSITDPIIDLIRIALLSKDQLYNRAGQIYSFSVYRKSDDGLLYGKEFELMYDLNEAISKESNKRIQKGIAYFDNGDYANARKYYDKAKIIHSKSDWAEYEIGQIELVTNSVKVFEEIKQGNDQPEFVNARTWNPFQTFAWQGTKQSSNKMIALTTKVLPAFNEIRKGISSKKPLLDFAEGTNEIGYHELSAYAYYMLIFYDSEASNDVKLEYANLMANNIEILGCKEAAKYVRDQFNLLFKGN